MSSDEALAIVSSDGVNDEGPRALILEFVNVGAVSQAEKQRNQKIISSTAMKSFRRRQQSERSMKGEGSSKDTAKPKSHRSKFTKDSQSDEQEASTSSYTGLSSDVSFSEVSRLLGGSSNDRKVDYFAFVDSNRSQGLSSQSPRAPSIVNSPVTLLGAGRVDPFRMLPGDTGSQSTGPGINELIDHCKL